MNGTTFFTFLILALMHWIVALVTSLFVRRDRNGFNSTEHETEASQPRLNLARGATELSILLYGVLALGAILSVFLTIHRFGTCDPLSWLYVGGPVSVLFISFIVRLYRWCGWKHVLLSLVPSLGSGLLISGLFLMGLDVREKYIALGVLVATILLPGLLGVGVASWAARYAKTAKRRGAMVLLAIAVVATLPNIRRVGWRVYTWYSSAHAETIGKAHLRAMAQNLKQTDVVPTLDAPISKGTNLIWCATFQMVWNELSTLAGEDIRMDSEDPSVALLNRKAVKKEQLDDETYFVFASATDTGNLNKVSEGLNDKFKGKESPELLATAQSLPPGALIAYAYLSANLPFEWAFDRQDFSLTFKGTEVESFGIFQYLKSQENERLAATQLFIYNVEKKPGFVIELKTRRTNHHLYLALIPPRATLGETCKEVLSRVKEIKPTQLEEGANLNVPVIDFDLTRDYVELTSRPLRVSKFAGLPIAMATQQIRFKLDERGAVLKSEAIGTLGSCSELVFDQPFLVVLQYADHEMPYFAAWIDNPELLVKK